MLSMVCGTGAGAVVAATGMMSTYCEDAIMFTDEHAHSQYDVVHGKPKKQTIRGKGLEGRGKRCGRRRRRRRRSDGVPW